MRWRRCAICPRRTRCLSATAHAATFPGAWRIGKVGVLMRRAAAIETLGSATVLCTDKTGTRSENRMSLAELWLPSGDAFTLVPDITLRQAYLALIETAALASAAEPSDPIEFALHGARTAIPEIAASNGTLAHAYALRPDLLATSNVWDRGGALTICAKGPPEAIAGLCHLAGDALAAITAAVETMAMRGIRVLTV